MRSGFSFKILPFRTVKMGQPFPLPTAPAHLVPLPGPCLEQIKYLQVLRKDGGFWQMHQILLSNDISIVCYLLPCQSTKAGMLSKPSNVLLKLRSLLRKKYKAFYKTKLIMHSVKYIQKWDPETPLKHF